MMAQATGIKGLIQAIGSLINPIIAILTGIALILFFWGLAKFVMRSGGSEQAVVEGKRLMIWGIIALFVMVSIAGIIRFAQIQLGLPAIPSLPPSDIHNINPFDPRLRG